MKIGDWLAEREPAPPPEVAALLEDLEDGPSLVRSLADAGMAALERAELRAGKHREAAFLLLAADALLTYACEAAAETSDPAETLWLLLDRIGSRA